MSESLTEEPQSLESAYQEILERFKNSEGKFDDTDANPGNLQAKAEKLRAHLKEVEATAKEMRASVEGLQQANDEIIKLRRACMTNSDELVEISEPTTRFKEYQVPANQRLQQLLDKFKVMPQSAKESLPYEPENEESDLVEGMAALKGISHGDKVREAELSTIALGKLLKEMIYRGNFDAVEEILPSAPDVDKTKLMQAMDYLWERWKDNQLSVPELIGELEGYVKVFGIVMKPTIEELVISLDVKPEYQIEIYLKFRDLFKLTAPELFYGFILTGLKNRTVFLREILERHYEDEIESEWRKNMGYPLQLGLDRASSLIDSIEGLKGDKEFSQAAQGKETQVILENARKVVAEFREMV